MGSCMMKLTLCRVTMRSLEAASTPAVQAQSTVLSSRNVITATLTPATVSAVRSLFRPIFRMPIVAICMAIQAPRSGNERALVETADDLRAFGGSGIVRHHDDGLVELFVESFEQVQDLVRALAIE